MGLVASCLTPSVFADSVSVETLDGGISIRRSAKLFVNLGGARKINLSSDPGGLFPTQVLHSEVNSTFTSSNLNGNNGGYVFSHWEVNGLRQADSKGIALSKINETMDTDKVITARFFGQNVDTDYDSIPDWYEWHSFGTLTHDNSSDPDLDGFTVADERKLGLNVGIEDNVTQGGISIRRSGKLSVNFGGGSELRLSSTPPGLLQTERNILERNSTFVSQQLGGVNNGYAFSHWEINGVRQTDQHGLSLRKITETLDSDKQIVAKYIEESLDSDGDGLLDWYEMHELGTLAHHGGDDPDGDGFSINREIQFGLSPSIPDQTPVGGISVRRAAPFSFSQQGPVQPVDSDGDGLNDGNESALGSNPYLADTDGDGFGDHVEWLAGTNLLNANDFPNQAPTSLELNNSSVAENLPADSPIGTFFVTDPNPGSSHSILLVEGNASTDNVLFIVDSNGTLRTLAPLDFEQKPSLTIRARATDEHNASIEGNFTIALLNQVEDLDGDGIEDHYDPDDDGDGFPDATETAYGSDPRDPNSVANAAPTALDLNGSNLLENQPAGTIVGKVSATDPDANSTLSYSLRHGNERFGLDTNGTLRTLVTLDYETNATAYPITVRVTDEHNASLESNFTIALLNQVEDLDGDGLEDHYDNDEDGDGFPDATESSYGSDPRDPNSVANGAPTTLDLNGSTILENRPIGTLVGRLLATDPDANATLSFSLVDGNGSRDNRLFRIEGATLRTLAIFDYEASAAPPANSPGISGNNAYQPAPPSLPASDTAVEQRDLNTSLPSLSNNEDHTHTHTPPLESNSTRRMGGSVRMENQPTRFHIRIRVTDEHNATLEKAFVIDLLNEIEDFDGDGIEDAFDTDDVIYPMPEIGPITVTLSGNGRASFSAGFTQKPDFPSPDFAFELSPDADFNRTLSSISGLVENDRIHGSLYDLQAGSAYYVRILATHRAKSMHSESTRFETEPERKLWWENAQKENGSWRTSPWLGSFLPDASGWIYHSEMDWLYVQSDPEGDLWLWQPKLGWLWTAQEVFPHLYGHQISDWYYFLKKKDGTPWFYDYSTESVQGGK